MSNVYVCVVCVWYVCGMCVYVCGTLVLAPSAGKLHSPTLLQHSYMHDIDVNSALTHCCKSHLPAFNTHCLKASCPPTNKHRHHQQPPQKVSFATIAAPILARKFFRSWQGNSNFLQGFLFHAVPSSPSRILCTAVAYPPHFLPNSRL